MRLQLSKTKNATSFYIVQSTYENGKRSNKIVEKLGTFAELSKIHDDPIAWGKEYAKELTLLEQENKRNIQINFSQHNRIPSDSPVLFNGGYLFLQKIYHELKLDKICKTISDKYRFSFDLNSVLSRLVYSRILFPASKMATFDISQKFLEKPNFDIQHVYRALEYLAKENDFIQAEVYKNSLDIIKRDTGVLYYDCTNYFFEIEEDDDFRKYGYSKEHRPNPLVQMGLFMDGSGIPLAFCMTPGNTNEQSTMRPLEEKILSDFNCSKFVVCTDAGLSSADNRRFNNTFNRRFVTTQPIKKLKKYLKDWVLNPADWRLHGCDKIFNISEFSVEDEEKYKDKIFYKKRWINDDEIEQQLIVTYSLKYRDYHRYLRQKHIERACNAMENNTSKLSSHKSTDYKRLIKEYSVTSDGELAKEKVFSLDEELIYEESMYDGLYAVCTNLEDDIDEIIKVNKNRWEIEESFRMMKNDFKARPVYLSREDRIKAHFLICFLSLLTYRVLEKRLDEKYTDNEILKQLKTMNFFKINKEGYIPCYTRTTFTDDLHEKFNFNTDYEIITNKNMKKILKLSKS